MLELVSGLFSTLISQGIGEFTKSKQLKTLRIVCIDRLLREVRFNKEVLSEIKEHNDKNKKRQYSESDFQEIKRDLILSLQTKGFDVVTDSMVPLGLIISGKLKLADGERIIVHKPGESYGFSSENETRFKGMVQKLEFLERLVERFYLRIVIAKSSKRAKDYEYIRYLSVILERNLMRLAEELRSS